MLSKEEADCIYAYNLHQVQIRINRCGEVMERKDYIRMDQEIIRTFAKSLMNNIHLKLKHCIFLHFVAQKTEIFTHEEVAK